MVAALEEFAVHGACIKHFPLRGFDGVWEWLRIYGACICWKLRVYGLWSYQQ